MGPLSGVRVVELAGIGPAPMCGMLLADMGAEVVRVDRVASSDLGISMGRQYAVLNRGRRSIALDLKRPEAAEVVLRLVERADVLIEGFRPGVTERMGLGPKDCWARNERLVYGRVTGWGQEGPLADAAGHDINYIALSGALHCIGPAGGPPTIPLNLIGDFGGGGMLLALGVLAALVEARTSGRGQVVDAAMVEGAGALMAAVYGMVGAGLHTMERGTNVLDGGAPYYGVYECADGRHVSVGAIEGRFWLELLERLGLDPADFPDRDDRANWPEYRERLRAIFGQRTRDEWCAVLEGTDVCFAPVLTPEEAPRHPHNASRASFVDRDGVVQPAAAPRFDRTPSEPGRQPVARGNDTDEVLAEVGYGPEERDALASAGVVARAS